MSALTRITSMISIGIIVIFQQGFLIGLGALLYEQGLPILAILIWCLCVPMLYRNYSTYHPVMK